MFHRAIGAMQRLGRDLLPEQLVSSIAAQPGKPLRTAFRAALLKRNFRGCTQLALPQDGPDGSREYNS